MAVKEVKWSGDINRGKIPLEVLPRERDVCRYDY